MVKTEIEVQVMAHITFDFNKVIGKIKPMHAVGQPPLIGANTSCFHYLKDAHIPYSRLHDVGGAYGGGIYVDIPNIFRNFDADETLPESYDFAFTDHLISSLMENDCEPIFRLGVTIENYIRIKRYYTDPPRDFAKWARICEHIIRHYTDGWADGFTYPIRYWEIWNEPENFETPELNQMWSGTAAQYYELYTVASKHLKSCFGDRIKVGGYASCGFTAIFGDLKKYGIDDEVKISEGILRMADSPRFQNFVTFFYGFLEHIQKHNAPLDFFSWHSYSAVENVLIMSRFVHNTLQAYGYGDVEIHLNEWNNAADKTLRGSSLAAVRAAAMLCGMQNSETHMLCYYDARIGSSTYGGMFNPITYEPFCLYHSFAAFGELYVLGNQIECRSPEKHLYVVGATNGTDKAVMIANNTGKNRSITTNLGEDMKVYLIDSEHHCTLTDYNAAEFALRKEQVALIKRG